MPPDASISCVPSGTSSAGPTAAIRSPTTSTSASGEHGVAVVHGQHRAAAEQHRPAVGHRCVVAIVSSGSTVADGCPYGGHAVERPTVVRRPALSRPRADAAGVRTLDSGSDGASRLARPTSADSCPRSRTMRGASRGDRPRPDRWPACWSPTSPGSWPGPTPPCCWPTSAPRWSRSRRPGGDDTRTWQPPVRDGVSTYYLGVNRNKRSIALDLKDAERPRRGPGAGPPRRRADRELQARRPGPLRPGLRRPSPPATPRVVYASISGFGSGAEGRGAARLRPDRAGDLRADEPDRRPRTGRRTGPASRSST